MSQAQQHIAHHAVVGGSGRAANGEAGPGAVLHINGATGGAWVPDTDSKLTCTVEMEPGVSGGLLADDDDVVAERCAVEAGEGLQDAMVSQATATDCTVLPF